MRDDFSSSAWADNHSRVSDALHAAIHKVSRVIGDGLARQNAYEFEAPWRSRASATKAGAPRKTA
ncbi:MAG: hypothetical protein V4472_26180 [Pseudomonadota bacterium]